MNTKVTASPRRHLDALTGIRGIAAWAVVLYHIRLSLTGLLPAPAIAALGQGYLAVDLFFILSGFVIWYNYADRIRSGGWGEASSFLWRRFARVWPLHAVVLAGFVLLALLLAATGRDTSGYPWAELPLHVMLIQNWGLTDALSWNHPAWSISAELAAYLLFPPILLATRWERWPSLALAVLAGAMALALHWAFSWRGLVSLGDDIPAFGVVRCLAGFYTGAILCLLWGRWREQRGASAMALAGACVLAGAGWLGGWAQTAVVPGCFALGLLALALDRGPVSRWLGGRALTYLGEISYSTYLCHFGLYIIYKLAFVDASLQLGWAQLAGYLTLVGIASVVLYHGLEKPAQRWLNARAPRIGMRSQAIPAE